MTEEVLRWGTMDSPLGRLYIAVSDRGVCAIERDTEPGLFVARLERRWPRASRIRHDPEAIRPVAQALARFLADPQAWPREIPVDLAGLTRFQQEVLEATRTIPPGQKATYGEIARWIGRPRAARAVGQALRRNPVPFLVPCHRVVGSGGHLGGYGGAEGLPVKIYLLRHEGALE